MRMPRLPGAPGGGAVAVQRPRLASHRELARTCVPYDDVLEQVPARCMRDSLGNVLQACNRKPMPLCLRVAHPCPPAKFCWVVQATPLFSGASPNGRSSKSCTASSEKGAQGTADDTYQTASAWWHQRTCMLDPRTQATGSSCSPAGLMVHLDARPPFRIPSGCARCMYSHVPAPHDLLPSLPIPIHARQRPIPKQLQHWQRQARWCNLPPRGGGAHFKRRPL
jgi:hypothetical protein